MPEDLRARLDALSDDQLVAIIQLRDLDEWRPEVFPVVEAILQERGVDLSAVPAREPTERLDYGALERVASFSGPLDASLRRMALEEAGIQAQLSTEHLAGIAPPLGIAIGVDLFVRPDLAESAREIRDLGLAPHGHTRAAQRLELAVQGLPPRMGVTNFNLA